MQTLLICSEKNIINHVNEEYNDFIKVPNTPTANIFSEWKNRIKQSVVKLSTENGNDSVEVYLDSTAPYLAVLIDLQVMLKSESGLELIIANQKE